MVSITRTKAIIYFMKEWLNKGKVERNPLFNTANKHLTLTGEEVKNKQ